MPAEYRFDELDLREEPARASKLDEADSLVSAQTKCITTTVNPTFYSCPGQTCTC